MLTREDTKRLKGIAILWMLIHHLYSFKERMPYGMELSSSVQVSGIDVIQILGLFGKICVPMFMFLGGYGLYASSVQEKTNLSGKKSSLSAKVIKLYMVYWKIFLVFIPIGIVFFSKQAQYCDDIIWNVFGDHSWKQTISDFVGLTSVYNREWWFLRTYVFALFEGYIFLELFKNTRNMYLELISVVIWYVFVLFICPGIMALPNFESMAGNVFVQNIFHIDGYAIPFFVGIIFKKYEIFTLWEELVGKLTNIEKMVVSVIVLAIAAYVRVFLVDMQLDILMTPIVIMATVLILRCFPILEIISTFLGKHSTNMWLTHSFFCYYFYPFVKVVYGSGNSLIALLVLTLLALGSSITINFLWKYIRIMYEKMHIFLLSREKKGV